MDAGTGGGFPGIPLSILFPEAEFTLVDSVAKKIKVVGIIKSELKLNNVEPLCGRFENIHGEFDFITGRAVSSLPGLWNALKRKISATGRNESPNGLLYLKGGEFRDELVSLAAGYRVFPLSGLFQESFFETKMLVHVFKTVGKNIEAH